MTALHLGLAETDMGDRFGAGDPGRADGPPAVADVALDGAEAGLIEVLADDWSRTIEAPLARDPREPYAPQLDLG